MNQDVVTENLAVVDAHFHSEATDEIEKAVALYTDDIVWEAPARQLILHGKRAAAENYRKMFGSMANIKPTTLRRFATEDRVVDDSIVTFTLTGDGVHNAPFPVGSDVELRLVHIFEMRDRRISRELVYEMWRNGALTGLPMSATDSAAVQPAELTPERIMQLGFGFWSSKTLLSAVELGVFTELAKGPLDGRRLAERLGLHPRSYRDFFDALVALGMLERRRDVYANTAETDFLLDRAKPSYVGGLLEMGNARLYSCWGALTEALRTGRPQSEAKDAANPFDALYSDPNGLQAFLQAMTGVSVGTAKAIAQKFPWDRYKSFIDIGAAQGATPVQVALAHAHLSGGGYDLPAVGPIFEAYVKSFGLSDRLRFHPGNFFTDALPSADVLIMGHILHDWNLEEKRMLIAKAYAALPPGGALLVYEALIDDERRQNAFGLLMSLNMLIETPGGFDYTGADCSAWMRAAGFRETRVEHLLGSDSMVVGIK
jgi:ketosteroid isomerase-like protein